MKTASVLEIKSEFEAVLKESKSGPVVVTRNRKPVAVIIVVHDEDEIERILMVYSPRLQAIVEASRRQIQAGEILGHEEFWTAVKASRGSNGRRKRKAGSRQ